MAKRAKKPTEPETPATPLRPAVKLDAHEPVAVELTGKKDHALLAAATRLYCKHLGEMQTKAEKMGRSIDAKRYEREAEGLMLELLDNQFEKGLHNQIFPRHRPILASGLHFLAVNLKAAKGTVSAVGAWTEDWVKELDLQAGYVETMLLPKFEDQTEMFAAGEPTDGKAAAAGKESDDTTLWVCPDCKRRYDVVPAECTLCGTRPVAMSTPIRAMEETSNKS